MKENIYLHIKVTQNHSAWNYLVIRVGYIYNEVTIIFFSDDGSVYNCILFLLFLLAIICINAKVFKYGSMDVCTLSRKNY